ncbi:MAG: sugar transferase [Flavobacteriales bacterium]
MNKKLQISKYIILDFLASLVAWALFYVYRKTSIEFESISKDRLFSDANFSYGIFAMAALWVVIYILLGHYRKIYRRSRLLELGKTIFQHSIGVLLIFFVFILDDRVQNYTQYIDSILVYFTLQTLLVYTFRFVLLSRTNRKIHRKEIGYPTLLIGAQNAAVDLFLNMEQLHRSSGNLFIGYLHPQQNVDEHTSDRISNYLPCLGNLSDLDQIIKQHQIQEVIIATEKEEHQYTQNIIERLENEKVEVKVLPTLYDILTGSVKLTSLFDIPLLHIQFKAMPVWQSVLKRLLDILISSSILILLSPFYAFVSLLVKLSSKGPVFYKQERIGLHGKPFQIIKFRSMLVDAEKLGPQLSSDEDPRITPWGKFMRQHRIDEFPQFYNVLIGEMSIVGPRPERQFFIDQLIEKAPYYKQVHRVRPGITSWGMVKFGYAENIDEMLERLKYDLIYIENLTIMSDFKVLFYTVFIVLQGRGK